MTLYVWRHHLYWEAGTYYKIFVRRGCIGIKLYQKCIKGNDNAAKWSHSVRKTELKRFIKPGSSGKILHFFCIVFQIYLNYVMERAVTWSWLMNTGTYMALWWWLKEMVTPRGFVFISRLQLVATVLAVNPWLKKN